MPSGTYLDEKQKTFLIENNKLGSLKLSNITGFERSTINKIFKKFGCQRTDLRKYKVNDNYFEKIDSDQKAYWLGFLYADGNLFLKGNCHIITLSQAESDGYIIEKYRDDIQAENPICTAINRRKNQQNGKQLVFNSKKMFNNLINLGCGPKKSLILKFPTNEQVPIEFLPGFIRGYFDGDGSICFGNKEKMSDPAINFCGTKEFLISLKDLLFNIFNVKSNNNLQKRHKNTINSYMLFITGRSNINRFYLSMYKNATRYIQRKFDRFDSHFKKFSNHA